MAARKTNGAKVAIGNPEQWRRKIQASALINRLQGYAKGEHEMEAAQVKAAEILLRKVLPDQTETKTEVTGNVTVKVLQFSGNNPPK